MNAREALRRWNPNRTRLDMTALGDRIVRGVEESETIDTITALAERVDISESVMGSIMRGDIEVPNRELLGEIAVALSIDVAELVDLINDEALEDRGSEQGL